MVSISLSTSKGRHGFARFNFAIPKASIDSTCPLQAELSSRQLMAMSIVVVAPVRHFIEKQPGLSPKRLVEKVPRSLGTSSEKYRVR